MQVSGETDVQNFSWQSSDIRTPEVKSHRPGQLYYLLQPTNMQKVGDLKVRDVQCCCQLSQRILDAPACLIEIISQISQPFNNVCDRRNACVQN